VLERAALHNPRHRRLFAAHARALASVGDYQAALDALARAHKAEGPDWRILSLQGALLDQIGRHEEARRYYGTALRITPEEPSVLSNLALSYAMTKDLVRAEATLRRAATQARVSRPVEHNLRLVVELQGGREAARRAGNVLSNEPAAAL